MSCNISILGACVLRDIFGLYDNNGGYTIDRFVQSISPLSAVTNSMLLKDFDEDDTEVKAVQQDLTNFYKRILKLDLQKGIFEYLAEKKSDYIMIDACACRYDLLKLSDGNTNKYITVIFENKLKTLIKAGYLPQSLELVSISSMDDFLFLNYMEMYVNAILKLYDLKQIILVECYCVPFAINKKRDKYTVFDNKIISKNTANIQRGFNYLHKRLKGCHVIKFPNGIIADEGHKWGGNPLHYIPEYYTYGFKAVDLITKNTGSLQQEQLALESLKYDYEHIIKSKYEPILIQNFKYYQARDNLCERMQRYEIYMKNLVLNEKIINNVNHFFATNRYTHCAFYGLNEISKLYILLCNKWGITVDYVIEESNVASYENIPCINRSEQNYPDTQIMIIADLINTKAIHEKLKKKNVTYVYIDAYQLLSISV